MTLLAAFVAATLAGRYFGLVLGTILGVVLFLAIVSVPIVLAIRRQRAEDRVKGAHARSSMSRGVVA